MWDADLPKNISIQEAVNHYFRLYSISNNTTKVLLKSWLYYCESMHSGGKLAVSFTLFKRKVPLTYLLSLVKGYQIDVSDIGDIHYVCGLLVNYFSIVRDNVS